MLRHICFKKNRHLSALPKSQLEEANTLLDQTKAALNAKSLCSPELNIELEKTLEELKDSKEANTALQLQLDTINQTHCLLKNSYEDLLNSNKKLERKLVELETTLDKYKNDILQFQSQNDKLQANENNLNKLLEIEKLQSKSLKLQNDKDAKCIKDLNRQIKEMERIIARKHPDSVSALIMAAKGDPADTNLTARKVLEDRIKTLEEEASNRDCQSAKIFLDIQEKFSQMKLKYENHIEDLELHVSDLKSQLKRKIDTYDVYTQTPLEVSHKIPQKDTVSAATQTAEVKKKELKEDQHLLATIRGLQADLSNKEKVVIKIQRDLEEMRRTNRKLQKEREGSLKSFKEFRSYPEKLSAQARSPDEEVKVLRGEKEKMRMQLSRIEEDYQALKAKRLHDLHALQEAHERELASYESLKEQLAVQQNSVTSLQSQLAAAKEEGLIMKIERDHVNQQLKEKAHKQDDKAVEELLKKITFLERRYEEREVRLRAIVHDLAQKNVTNKGCRECAERQNQLVYYKNELEQILTTLRALK